MKEKIIKIIESWANINGNINDTQEIIEWVNYLNKTTEVEIKESKIEENTFWFYDEDKGEILNKKGSFFSIKGIKMFHNDKVIIEQPIIKQSEIGYLGIICKRIDGVMNFLMQAKIEPGNINCVQISPTIQATKSNFTRMHGGHAPLYFEYFRDANKHSIILDQIQSEQSSRFYKKRNRNMIIEIDEDIEVYPNYKWMTLGQIKQLMKIDNLVNMDTRTVISGIPFIVPKFEKDELEYIEALFNDKELYNSIFFGENMSLIDIYHYINNFKMFNNKKIKEVPLNELSQWIVSSEGIECKEKSDFIVKYYDVSINGREVQKWTQPLLKANGIGIFGLITCKKEGKRKFLINAKSEIGCFDRIELGPSVQIEPTSNFENNAVESLFKKKLENNSGIKIDVLLSEEGGRFYHEQNRNVILEVHEGELSTLPEGYFWLDYSTLNYLIQVNNCLNIQLRNLISLLEV